MKHNPAPWTMGIGHCIVSDTPVPEMGGSDATDYYGGHLIAESVVERNAERIVACVNACEGIKTGYLLALVGEGSSINKEAMALIYKRVDAENESRVLKTLALELLQSLISTNIHSDEIEALISKAKGVL